MEHSKIGSWVFAAFAAVIFGTIVYQQAHAPLTTDQQTITSATTSVVVVLIPGFPIESVLLGALMGFIVLMTLRRQRAVH